MGISVFFKPLSLSLAIIILIESLIWAILSFLCVLYYSDVIKYDVNNTDTSWGLNAFMNSLYELYLSGKSFANNSRAVIPSTFNILMWIYFILSILLFFCSATHLTVLCQKSKLRKINLSTLIWQTLVYTVCIYDLITCILFSVDYHLIKTNIKTNTADTEIQLAVSITLLVLAAKGFVLWILNFTLSVIISIIFRKKVENEPILQVNPEMYARSNVAYNAYGDVNVDPQIPPSSTETNAVEQPKSNDSDSDHESESSLGSFGINDDTVTVISTFPRPIVPRARTDSYQTPRSLMSRNTSPIPPPSRPSTHLYHEPIINSRRQSVYEKDAVHDENVINSPSYLSSAFPNKTRFNLQEPTPDYY